MLAAFRAAIEAAAPHSAADSIEPLRRARELFPASARLVGLLGKALRDTGRGEEALVHQAYALSLRSTAEIHREEFGDQATPPEWLFAYHICEAEEKRGRKSA